MPNGQSVHSPPVINGGNHRIHSPLRRVKLHFIYVKSLWHLIIQVCCPVNSTLSASPYLIPYAPLKVVCWITIECFSVYMKAFFEEFEWICIHQKLLRSKYFLCPVGSHYLRISEKYLGNEVAKAELVVCKKCGIRNHSLSQYLTRRLLFRTTTCIIFVGHWKDLWMNQRWPSWVISNIYSHGRAQVWVSHDW